MHVVHDFVCFCGTFINKHAGTDVFDSLRDSISVSSSDISPQTLVLNSILEAHL